MRLSANCTFCFGAFDSKSRNWEKITENTLKNVWRNLGFVSLLYKYRATYHFKIFCKVTIYTHIHIRTKNENVRRPCADNHISTVYGFYLQLTSLIDLKHCLKKHPFKESIFQADLLMPWQAQFVWLVWTSSSIINFHQHLTNTKWVHDCSCQYHRPFLVCLLYGILKFSRLSVFDLVGIVIGLNYLVWFSVS